MTAQTRRRVSARVLQWLTVQWCSWTHGGGHITRDPLNRINWQCLRCGRWSDPISHEDETATINSALTGRTTEGR